MTRLAIFDCDGTLVDSGHTIFVALRRTLDEHQPTSALIGPNIRLNHSSH